MVKANDVAHVHRSLSGGTKGCVGLRIQQPSRVRSRLRREAVARNSLLRARTFVSSGLGAN